MQPKGCTQERCEYSSNIQQQICARSQRAKCSLFLPVHQPKCLYESSVSPTHITCPSNPFLLNLITNSFYCRDYESVQGLKSPAMMPSCWASSSPCFNASKCLGALGNTNPTKKCDIPEDTLFSITAVRRSTHV